MRKSLIITAIFGVFFAIGINVNCEKCDPEETGVPLLAEECSQYYKCENGTLILMDCPDGLNFNKYTDQCDIDYVCTCPEDRNISVKFATNVRTTYMTCENGIFIPHDCPAGYNYNSITRDCDEKGLCPSEDEPDNPFRFNAFLCSQYHQCSNGYLELRSCPEGFYFNEETTDCDSFENVYCPDGIRCNATYLNPTDSSPTEFDPNVPVFLPGPTCSEFYKCLNGEINELSCGEGLQFNVNIGGCYPPEKANCQQCPTEDDPNNPISFPASNFIQFFKCINSIAVLHDCPDDYDSKFNPLTQVCESVDLLG